VNRAVGVDDRHDPRRRRRFERDDGKVTEDPLGAQGGGLVGDQEILQRRQRAEQRDRP